MRSTRPPCPAFAAARRAELKERGDPARPDSGIPPLEETFWANAPAQPVPQAWLMRFDPRFEGFNPLYGDD